MKRCIPGRNTGQDEKVKGGGQVQGHGALSPASEPGGVCPTPAVRLGRPGCGEQPSPGTAGPHGAAQPGQVPQRASLTESGDSGGTKSSQIGGGSRQDPELSKAAAQGCQSWGRVGCADSSIAEPAGSLCARLRRGTGSEQVCVGGN